MFDVILQEVGKVIVAVVGVILFLVLVILSPVVLVFMLALECVIRALDYITGSVRDSEWLEQNDKEMWKGNG